MFELIAYVNKNDLSLINDDDIKQITIINLAFANIINDNLKFEVDDKIFINDLNNTRQRNSEIKIILSIGGWSSGGFSEIASEKESRLKFAEQCIELIEKYSLDGIDIDWEYPGFKVANIKSSENDSKNFTLLLHDLRQKLDAKNKNLILSIAAAADDYFVFNTEVAEYIKYLDYIQLMTYDYRSGFSVVTGHHTNLFTPKYDMYMSSVNHAIEMYRNNNVPNNKLIIGVAYYSREWTNVIVKSAQDAYGVYVGSTGGYGPSYDEIIDNNLETKYTKVWDNIAKAPYLYGENRFITYDDLRSIEEKIKYVKENKLAGLMFWEYRLAHKSKLTSYIGKKLN